MKKIILCLSLIVLVSTCFVTNAIAAPKITEIRGGYGVSATVVNATGRHWTISIQGPFIKDGTLTEGFILRDNTTIRTPLYPPAFGIGPVIIRVTIDRIILPDIIKTRPALMLGPFVLFRNISKPVSS